MSKRKAFVLSAKINYIMNLRKALAREEDDLAVIGKDALEYYHNRIGASSLPYGQLSARLDSKGTNLVYDLGSGTIQVLPVDFLYDPDGFKVQHEQVVSRSQVDHNYVVTNYP